MIRDPRVLGRILLPVVVVSVGAIGILVLRARSESVSTKPTAARPEPVLLVEAVRVRVQSVRSENRLSGQVEPVQVATIAAEVGARIVARPREQGDNIVRGGLVAALDDDAARASLDQAIASYDQARATRSQAESEYARAFVETEAARQQAGAQLMLALAGEQKTRRFTRDQELRQAEAGLSQARTDERLARIEAQRYRDLVGQGATAQQMLDRAQADLDAAVARRVSAEQAVSLAREGARSEDITAARAQVETARAGQRIANTRPARLAALRKQIDALRAQEAQAAAQTRQARIHLAKHRVLSPFGGRVLATLAEAGEMVAPSTPLVRVGRIAQVKVTFRVPEASRAALRLGQPVTITADAVAHKAFTGRITLLGFEADQRARTFAIEVTVSNPREDLLPNMVARLRLPLGLAIRRALVPVEAVAIDGATPYVFVLDDNKAVRRDVVLGTPLGDQVEVLRGLAPGQQIAATPQRLTDGARVRVPTPPAPLPRKEGGDEVKADIPPSLPRGGGRGEGQGL